MVSLHTRVAIAQLLFMVKSLSFHCGLQALHNYLPLPPTGSPWKCYSLLPCSSFFCSPSCPSRLFCQPHCCSSHTPLLEVSLVLFLMCLSVHPPLLNLNVPCPGYMFHCPCLPSLSPIPKARSPFTGQQSPDPSTTAVLFGPLSCHFSLPDLSSLLCPQSRFPLQSVPCCPKKNRPLTAKLLPA